jgi:hypothetical protein
MVGAILVGYVLSPMPLGYVTYRCGLTTNDPVLLPLVFATYPLRIAAENSPMVNEFYDAEWRWLTETFGDPQR